MIGGTATAACRWRSLNPMTNISGCGASSFGSAPMGPVRRR